MLVLSSTNSVLFKITQTTWKDFCWHRESTQYKCPVVPCCGIGTWSWGGRAGGHSVSWQKLAAQEPWRHVSHHRWESADRQTAGMWRRRSRRRRKSKRDRDGRERQGATAMKHLVRAGLLPSSTQDNSPNIQPAPTCAGGPIAKFKYYQTVCNIQQPERRKACTWVLWWKN